MKRLLAFFHYPEPGPARGLHLIHRAGEEPRYGGVLPAAYYHTFGLLLNLSSMWIGAHYSPAHKRLCVNLLPCVTLWWTKPGGQLP
jgi:hypothetical protein